MTQQGIFQMLFEEDDVKWQSLIYEMVRTGKIDPWDVDITKFSNEYLVMLEKLKQMNFRVSGKVVLAAAILLKLKMNRLGLEDFIMLTEEPDEEYGGIEEEQYMDEEEAKLLKLAKHIQHNKKKRPDIEPRLVGPRTRKVTVFELMDALKKAIEVDDRREERRQKFLKEVPKEDTFKRKKLDIFSKMKNVYDRLRIFVKKANRSTVEFGNIVPSKEKKDVIWTFVPLLHLANEGKVTLMQEKPFSKIYVELVDKGGVVKKDGKS